MRRNVLGVKIDDVSMEQATILVQRWLVPSGQGVNFRKKPLPIVKRYIVTPNPEFVVAAQNDEWFKDILNNADLSIPDGIGLRLFAGFKNRLAGIDFMESLISLSAEKGLTIGFLGSEKGIAEKAAERLSQRYQNISIDFIDDGGSVNDNGFCYKRLEIPKLDILFVGFGMVKQEKWISKNLDRFSVRLMIGVGRSFDYLSNTLPRSPMIIRSLGFEWLYSLVMQPWRIKRQVKLLTFLKLLYIKHPQL